MMKPVIRLCILILHSCFVLHAKETAGWTNIVFIMADDAGIGDFSAYGCKYGRTPNIDRLAAEGMQFTRAYSGSAVCAPTRCALMTGRHTGRGLRRANMSKHGRIFLPAGQMTVARLLKDAGYATGGFGKWGLGNPGSTGVPEKQGFDLFYGYYDQRHAHDYYTDHLIRNGAKETLAGNADGGKGTYSHDLIVGETLGFIERNRSKPFFCYAAWTLPHGQYVIPSNDPYAGKKWPEEIKNYASMVALLDRDVGRLMAKLKELGLDENTLVIFTSDNGANEPFIKPLGSTGGLRGHKRMLYEGGIRAPFIARWPGRIAPGTKSDLLTSHVDFMATAAGIAGVPAPDEQDGTSILPALLGEDRKKKNDFLYFEIYEPHFQQTVIADDGWKGYRLGTKAPLELYNLQTDPGEKRNVADGHPEIVRRLEAILEREHTPSPYWNAPAHARKGGQQGAKAGGNQQQRNP